METTKSNLFNIYLMFSVSWAGTDTILKKSSVWMILLHDQKVERKLSQLNNQRGRSSKNRRLTCLR